MVFLFPVLEHSQFPLLLMVLQWKEKTNERLVPQGRKYEEKLSRDPEVDSSS